MLILRAHVLLLAALLPLCAVGQPSRTTAAASTWVVPAPRLAKEAYFSNLKDGDSIETPFLIKFGLGGLGVASTAKTIAKTGHHHLLVNRELPLDFSRPLPFDEHYIHFGEGQMETVVNFPPGKYSLRLVMANERHIPNFVYSKPVSVTVTQRRADVDPKSLIRKTAALLLPAEGAVLSAPLRVAFHVSGYNVSPAAITDKGTGHFRLRVKADAGREEVMDLTGGLTEVWIKPPAGSYSARVEFIDNATAGHVLLKSEPVNFSVR